MCVGSIDMQQQLPSVLVRNPTRRVPSARKAFLQITHDPSCAVMLLSCRCLRSIPELPQRNFCESHQESDQWKTVWNGRVWNKLRLSFGGLLKSEGTVSKPPNCRGVMSFAEFSSSCQISDGSESKQIYNFGSLQINL